MTTLDTTHPVLVEPVHAPASAVLGVGSRVGEDPPPGRLPVAGGSAVWDG